MHNGVPKRKRATISDIAARAGVSKGAVSFALNNRPGVSDDTRARILDIAEQLEWRPHSAARALGAQEIGAIGFALSRPARTLGTEAYFGSLLSGIQSALAPHGVGLYTVIVDDLEAEVATYRAWWRERRVDACILVDLRADDPRLALFDEIDLPAVAVAHPGGLALPAFSADDALAMRRLLRHLADLGHRRIAHVTGPVEFRHTAERIRTGAEAVAAGEFDAIDSIPSDYSDAQGAETTRELLSRADRPTAIIYDNDVLALAALGVARDLGVGVPDDVTIVSFDDSILMRVAHPSVTALSSDVVGVGARVGEAALRLGRGDDLGTIPPAPQPELIVRDSSGPATPRA